MIDRNGKEMVRFNEFVKPDKFAAAMKCSTTGGKAPEAVGMR